MYDSIRKFIQFQLTVNIVCSYIHLVFSALVARLGELESSSAPSPYS